MAVTHSLALRNVFAQIIADRVQSKIELLDSSSSDAVELTLGNNWSAASNGQTTFVGALSTVAVTAHTARAAVKLVDVLSYYQIDGTVTGNTGSGDLKFSGATTTIANNSTVSISSLIYTAPP